MSTLTKISASAALVVALAATPLTGASADDRVAWLAMLQRDREAAVQRVEPVRQVAAAPLAAARPSRGTVFTGGAAPLAQQGQVRAAAPLAPAPRASASVSPSRGYATPVATAAVPAAPSVTAGLRPTVSARAPQISTRTVGGRIILQPLTPEENRARATQLRQAALAPGGGMPQMDPAFLPATVEYAGAYAPGTIVIDTTSKYLYLVQPGGMAKRYGVGIGREGFQWTGSHKVSMKREWPGWTPPAAMRKRQPELPAFMEGGPDNPLGARALYLGSSIYRIHGSNAPWTIGTEVSSGCFRMRNDDVIELYELVKVGTRVVVL